jgi:selenide,water dikinase
VKKGGCAAKIAAVELRKILASVRFPPPVDGLLIDGRHFDDAAVIRLNAEQAIVQTIDFFTPVIDSPFDFGRVAAANALSDVYAMGGKPFSALAVLAFPLGVLPGEVITEVLNGASDVMTKASTALVGGHSIDDESLKFGLSVTGLVHPDRVWANTGARVGDVLILTKALGTGTLTAALKREVLGEAEIKPAIDSMALLNNAIDPLSDLVSAVHAATDITGFGLSGHSMQMAKASDVRLKIDTKLLPRLPHADECLKREILTKAHRTNAEYTGALAPTEALSVIDRLLVHDPQTSGGLLLSVAAAKAQDILTRLKPHFPAASMIGEVMEREDGVSVSFT